jgi:deoxyribonuclease (pyrimidine dimer)
MTRINIGIEPHELCDKHLLAEYRELPRIWRARLVSKAPPNFKLGPGHVLWCAQYPRTIADQFSALVAEMLHRGWSPSFLTPPAHAAASPVRAPAQEIARARPLLQARIRERLATMPGATWTRRARPRWA